MRTIIIWILLSPLFLFSQENTIVSDPQRPFFFGMELFEEQLYGTARMELHRYIDFQSLLHEDPFTNRKDDAGAVSSIAGLRLNLLNSEVEILRFAKEKYPDPVATAPIMELGSYYYNKKLFKKCIDIYDLLEIESLPKLDKAETAFKKGYAYFALAKFDDARKTLRLSEKIKSEYYYPTHYYLGMIEYFLKNNKGALFHFDIAKSDPIYEAFIPYYLTQIEFTEGNYDKVIEVGENALSKSQLRNRKEIRLLVGQAYFKKEQYDKAQPHLEHYEAHSEKMTEDEFYQLGYTHYKLNDCLKAKKSFLELSNLDNEKGQMSNYYLADCYYREKDFLSARTAFRKVSQMNHIPTMRDEAQLNYAKLSAESGMEREAISTLIKIPTSSKYHDEATTFLMELLDKTSDYAFGLQTIESLSNINDKLKVTYQNLALKMGLQLYLQGQKDEAIPYFDKATLYSSSRIAATQGYYWKALILHEKGDFKGSNQLINQYFNTGKDITWMPDESNHMMAYYIQGYNHLSGQDYTSASKSFQLTLDEHNKYASKLKNERIKEDIWADATLRLGDCMFKVRNYNGASEQYSKVIRNGKTNVDYALYQKAMIQGLKNEPFEKILLLKDLVNKFPSSEFADDAYVHLGDTYFDEDNKDNAYAAFQTLIKNYPNSEHIVNSYLKMALIAYNKGDLNTAIAHYKKVFEYNPTKQQAESALLGLQEIYVNDLGKSDEYVKFVNALPGYNINNAAADSLAYAVGVLRYNEGNYDKAITAFTDYLQKYPKGLNILRATYYRAESHTLLKQYSQAILDYEKVISMGNSEFYPPSLKKAALIAYNYLQNFEKAYQHYDKYHSIVIAPDEKFQSALGALRSAFRTTNHAAVIQYGQLVANNTLASRDEKNTAQYYIGKVQLRDKNYDKAIEAFSFVANSGQNNQAAESRYLLAEIYYIQGKKDKAEQQCNAANEANASYPYWIAKSLLLLSDIYVDNNDLFNARAAVEAVIDNFKDDAELLKIANDKLKNIEALEANKSRLRPKNSQNQLIEMIPAGKN